MAADITNIGGATTGRTTIDNGPRATQTGPDSSTSPASVKADSVQITDSATRLKNLEARLAELPVVDQERVQAVRTAIAEGRFEVDSEQVATKLIEFEKALGVASND